MLKFNNLTRQNFQKNHPFLTRRATLKMVNYHQLKMTTTRNYMREMSVHMVVMLVGKQAMSDSTLEKHSTGGWKAWEGDLWYSWIWEDLVRLGALHVAFLHLEEMVEFFDNFLCTVTFLPFFLLLELLWSDRELELGSSFLS